MNKVECDFLLNELNMASEALGRAMIIIDDKILSEEVLYVKEHLDHLIGCQENPL